MSENLTEESKSELVVMTEEEKALQAFYEENQDATGDAPEGMPRLSIVQPMSNEMNRSKKQYNEDAKPGLFCHNVSGVCTDKIAVTPIRYADITTHWSSKDGSGERPLGAYAKGAANHPPFDLVDGWKMEAKDGTFLQPGLQFILWVRDLNSDTDLGPAIFVAKSTALKYAKAWRDKFSIRMTKGPNGSPRKVPFIAQEYVMTTWEESGDQGIWYSPEWNKGTNITDMERLRLYTEARQQIPEDVFLREENHEGDDGGAIDVTNDDTNTDDTGEDIPF